MNCCVFRSLDPYKNLIDYHCKDTELLKISSMYCENLIQYSYEIQNSPEINMDSLTDKCFFILFHS